MRVRREKDYTDTGERRYDDVPLSIRICAIFSCSSLTISVTYIYTDYLDPLIWKAFDWALGLLSLGAPPLSPGP